MTTTSIILGITSSSLNDQAFNACIDRMHSVWWICALIILVAFLMLLKVKGRSHHHRWWKRHRSDTSLQRFVLILFYLAAYIAIFPFLLTFVELVLCFMGIVLPVSFDTLLVAGEALIVLYWICYMFVKREKIFHRGRHRHQYHRYQHRKIG